MICQISESTTPFRERGSRKTSKKTPASHGNHNEKPSYQALDAIKKPLITCYRSHKHPQTLILSQSHTSRTTNTIYTTNPKIPPFWCQHDFYLDSARLRELHRLQTMRTRMQPPPRGLVLARSLKGQGFYALPRGRGPPPLRPVRRLPLRRGLPH